jgi:hypothetical protein
VEWRTVIPHSEQRPLANVKALTMTVSSDNPGVALEKLAAELNGSAYEAHVVTGQGQQPFLHVRNRHASILNEDIYAANGWFWFGWAERIAQLSDIAAAAQQVARVLRAAGE